jgi:hypothetical protein
VAFLLEKCVNRRIIAIMEDKNLYDLKSEAVEEDALEASQEDKKPSTTLDNLQEANGKVASSKAKSSKKKAKKKTTKKKVDLSKMEYADGKQRDEIDIIEEQEKLYGTDVVSPYKTADKRVFKRRLETMSRPKMYQIAERVGARVYTGEQDMRDELMNSFNGWFQTQGGSFQVEASKKAEKGALHDAFEDSNSVKELEEKLKSKTLSDLQSTAARLGFNPSFDRERLVKVITQEFKKII